MFDSPKFWKNINIISLILYPFSIIYSWISKLKYSLQIPNRLNCRTICIGNVSVGGAGKTPLAIAIGKLLLIHKHKIAYACKNYGATIQKPTQVTSFHNTAQIIDEAFLLANIAPSFVAKKRNEAVKLASTAAEIIIADDGLQNNSFHKDLSILAIPKDTTFGNNLIFPAGSLRESLKSALKKTDLVVMINEIDNSHSKTRAVIEKHFDRKKIFKAIAKYKLNSSHKKKYIAFCGIAHPDNFFTTLKKLDVKLMHRLSFPDHYNYTKQDLQRLLDKAKKLNANLITTEKDFVRLNKTYKEKIIYLKYDLEILDEKNFLNHLTSLTINKIS